jgi:NADH pyrophosphatase NudC (nudix superfamily)
MDLGAIFLLLGVVVIVVVFVAQPFTQRWRARVQSGQAISVLLANRENALSALQELDFDFKLDKILPEEYSIQRASLLQMGAEALRQLDEIQATQTSPIEEPVKPAAIVKPSKPLADEDLEELVAKRRTARQQKAAGFCPKCGKPILQSDRFCSSCGQVVDSKLSELNY